MEWKDSLHRKTLAEDMMEVELKAMRKKDAQEKRKEQVCGKGRVGDGNGG